MPDVVMPRLSDSMEEGTILQWLKQVGDEIALGDELVEIETDKANMAYESDLAGTLTEIVAQEGYCPDRSADRAGRRGRRSRSRRHGDQTCDPRRQPATVGAAAQKTAELAEAPGTGSAQAEPMGQGRRATAESLAARPPACQGEGTRSRASKGSGPGAGS